MKVIDFQNLRFVEEPQFYIGKVFRQTKKSANKIKVKGKKQIDRVKYKELKTLNILEKILVSDLDTIVSSFPTIDNLPEFYQELINVNIGVIKLKKALATMTWIKNKVKILRIDYAKKIKTCNNINKIFIFKKGFYGRVSSLLKKKEKEFLFLQNSQKIMKKFPTIKTETPLACICGFPNVGKSTILKKLSGAKVEIKPYPFTTKRLLLGQVEYENKKFQVLDTPGLFDRPLEKRNKIELHSILALKHITNLILFVIDPTESYPLEQQINLLEDIRNMLTKPILVIINKKDLCSKERIERIKEMLKDYKTISISATKGENLNQVIKIMFSKHFI